MSEMISVKMGTEFAMGKKIQQESYAYHVEMQYLIIIISYDLYTKFIQNCGILNRKYEYAMLR